MEQPLIRQAITTRFLGATNSRGSRIKAKCAAKSITVYYAHELNIDENHIAARNQLVHALNWGWQGEWVTGVMDNGDYAHVIKM